MPDPFETGDELKRQYMEKALHANEEAMSGAKMTDLLNKDSVVYKDPNPEPQRERTPLPEKPTVDAEGYPIIQHVHTYKEDLAGIINSDKLSLSRIAMMQEDSNRKTEAPSREEADKKKSMIFYIISVSLVLIGTGIIGGIFVLTQNKKTANTQPVVKKEKYILFAEKQTELNITKATKTEMAKDIKDISSRFQEEDSMMEIVPSLTTDNGLIRSDLKTLFGTLYQRVPDELLRTLYSKYFLGLYSKKGKTDPFLLMFTNSYDISYPALLEWEGYMKDDLIWLYDTNIKIGTTTPKLTFKDRVVYNTDARSFEDPNGKVAFFYTFIDPNTILFARNTDTIKKVVDRLREAKFQ